MSTDTAKYDAVVFDLLTALLNSWKLWNDVAGSEDAGMRWRRKYLEITYGCGAYRSYADRSSRRRPSPRVIRPPLRSTSSLAGISSSRGRRRRRCWQSSGGACRSASPPIAPPCWARAAQRTGSTFKAVITARSPFYKPRPETYLAVLAALGTAPARTLFVAGSASDVPGAQSVGMPVFWHNRIGLPAVGPAKPEFTARSLEPLLDIVR